MQYANDAAELAPELTIVVRPCTGGGMLAWFMAGMTAGWVAVTPRGWC